MDIQYEIIHSKRRSISLVVSREGKVTVRAPKQVSDALVKSFIAEKQAWVVKHLEKAKQYQFVKKQFTEGELFLFLGGKYPLHFIPEFRTRLIFDNGFFISKIKLPKAKELFIQWYKAQAEEVINSRVKTYARLMDIQYGRVTIRTATTRWGSCSGKNNLNFNWQLVLAPLEIVDYVVVHELCHVVHKNHGAEFWALVEKYYPAWKLSRKWLKAQGTDLAHW